MKKKKKVYKDKNGREYIKESYFVRGEMKFYRVYVIDGIPVDEFYEKNATDLDFHMNGDYHLMSEYQSNNLDDEQTGKKNVSQNNDDDIFF